MRGYLRFILALDGRELMIARFVGIILAIVLTVFLSVQLNAWNKPFYDAIERRDLDAFLHQLVVFGVLASALLALDVADTWLDITLKVDLRKWSTRRLMRLWDHGHAAIRSEAVGSCPDQRIHADLPTLGDLSLALSTGLFRNALLFGSFVVVLYGQPFLIRIGESVYSVPGFMVWAALVYGAIGMLLTWKVGRPLIDIGQRRSAREADLRSALVHSAASDERDFPHLEERLSRVVDVMMEGARRGTALTSVTAAHGWLAIVVPIVVASPSYFAGVMSFGDLMLAAGAFGQVQTSLRWFLTNASAIAQWRSALFRVMNFHDALSSEATD